jgi:hypothetical protein
VNTGEDPDHDAGDHEKLHQKLAEDGKANLAQIAELMKKIQSDLAEKQTGENTQSRQNEVVRKLDELIDRLGKG